MINSKAVFLIGYSGHSFVICDIFLSKNIEIKGYFENVQKIRNPYELAYFGNENDKKNLELLKETDYFVAIGSNIVRSIITQKIKARLNKMPINAIHNSASISSTVVLGKGIMVGDGAIVNACVELADGVICNTQSVVEHESKIGAFSHIAPGAILCGNVKVGRQTFIGARAVIKQGVTIGDNVIIGAGTVIIKDIPSNSKVVGNPQKFI
ncbi:MAG: acetyltransferase [Saprospiraceae bacterium]